MKRNSKLVCTTSTEGGLKIVDAAFFREACMDHENKIHLLENKYKNLDYDFDNDQGCILIAKAKEDYADFLLGQGHTLDGLKKMVDAAISAISWCGAEGRVTLRSYQYFSELRGRCLKIAQQDAKYLEAACLEELHSKTAYLETIWGKKAVWEGLNF